jgi:hypothetical protein
LGWPIAERQPNLRPSRFSSQEQALERVSPARLSLFRVLPGVSELDERIVRSECDDEIVIHFISTAAHRRDVDASKWPDEVIDRRSSLPVLDGLRTVRALLETTIERFFVEWPFETPRHSGGLGYHSGGLGCHSATDEEQRYA